MPMTEDTIQLRRAINAVNDMLLKMIHESERKVRDLERRVERLEEEASSMTETSKPDLTLAALDSFCGTQEYHKVLGFNVTDGVTYIMQNGYAYLVTDLLSVILFKPRLRKAEFLVITYTVNLETGTAQFEIREDSDRPVLYSQEYGYTDAKRPEIKLFYESGVLLLAGEH